MVIVGKLISKDRLTAMQEYYKDVLKEGMVWFILIEGLYIGLTLSIMYTRFDTWDFLNYSIAPFFVIISIVLFFTSVAVGKEEYDKSKLKGVEVRKENT